jgi:hypothetical protein
MDEQTLMQPEWECPLLTEEEQVALEEHIKKLIAQQMTNDEADDIVEDWHNGKYPEGVTLRNVFIDEFGWTGAEFDRWVETAKTP